MKTLQKIVWAVDPIDTENKNCHALFLLGALTRATGATVEPVYILTHAREALRALAEKRMLELSKTSDIPTMTSGNVLLGESSMRKNAQRLVDHSIAIGADAIVVNTHARQGISRMLLGSFAETVILCSSLPILTVNPHTLVRETISNILLATTFQDRFRASFEQIVKLAKESGARLTLFYKEPGAFGPGLVPETYAYIEPEANEKIAVAEQWRQWAVHQGVLTEIAIDKKPGDVESSIEQFAGEHNFDLIAMISEADKVSAVLMGSMSRQVIRRAPCPVWVMRLDPLKR